MSNETVRVILEVAIDIVVDESTDLDELLDEIKAKPHGTLTLKSLSFDAEVQS